MKKKNIKYCYREPDYPESAYLGVTFISTNDGFKFIHPMMEMQLTLKALKTRINKFEKELTDKKNGPLSVYGVVVIKINFNKTFPLKKEYWIDTKDSPIKPDFRVKEYMKMLDDVYQFYNIMILPDHYDVKKKKWHYINWIPVLVTTDDKKFEELALISDEPVDPSSKSIGIYSIEFVRGFDLDTLEFVKSQKEIDLEEANC